MRTNSSGALGDASDVVATAYRGIASEPGKGADHARAVAGILHAAGCAEPVEVAGMLHDVVEDTAWTVDDVRDRFGGTVAALVGAVTEDSTIRGFRRRKRALREQIAGAGPAAADIALADKVASLRHAVDTGMRVPRHKLSHYAATVEMADNPGHPALAAEAGRLLTVLAERERAGQRPPGAPRRPGVRRR